MADQKQAAQGSAATAQQSPKFSEMSRGQKVKFILKVVVCMLSFGFIFSHVLSE